MEPIWEKLREAGAKLIFLDGCKIARTETGTPQGANFVLLGVLSKRVPEFPISSSILKKIIGENETNLKCFELGYQYLGD